MNISEHFKAWNLLGWGLLVAVAVVVWTFRMSITEWLKTAPDENTVVPVYT